MGRNVWVAKKAMAAEGDASSAPEKPRRGRPPGSKTKPKKKGPKGVGKQKAVALAIEELGPETDNEKLAAHVKARYKHSLKPNNISQYKSNYLKHLREGGAPATLDAIGATPVKKAKAPGDATVEEIRDLKALSQRMGIERFRELIGLICD